MTAYNDKHPYEPGLIVVPVMHDFLSALPVRTRAALACTVQRPGLRAAPLGSARESARTGSQRRKLQLSIDDERMKYTIHNEMVKALRVELHLRQRDHFVSGR